LDTYDNAWYWWLRSPGIHSNIATLVNDGGRVNADGNFADISEIGVRPAIYITLKP
jgi:hypothetical protein